MWSGLRRTGCFIAGATRNPCGLAPVRLGVGWTRTWSGAQLKEERNSANERCGRVRPRIALQRVKVAVLGPWGGDNGVTPGRAMLPRGPTKVFDDFIRFGRLYSQPTI